LVNDQNGNHFADSDSVFVGGGNTFANCWMYILLTVLCRLKYMQLSYQYLSPILTRFEVEIAIENSKMYTSLGIDQIPGTSFEIHKLIYSIWKAETAREVEGICYCTSL
jgi:hypothetical protein